MNDQLFWRRNRSTVRWFCGIVVIFVASVLPMAVQAQSRDSDYTGNDSGYLIYSVSNARYGMRFQFPYRRIADGAGSTVDDWRGRIRPHLGGLITLSVRNPHFSDSIESGHVIVRRLPAGRYLIEDFDFGGMSPSGGAISFSSGVPFAITFDISPGRASYIGRFTRSPSISISGATLYRSIGYLGYFVISNKVEQDMPIARSFLATLPNPDIQVTDVTIFNNDLLRSAHIP